MAEPEQEHPDFAELDLNAEEFAPVEEETFSAEPAAESPPAGLPADLEATADFVAEPAGEDEAAAISEADLVPGEEAPLESVEAVLEGAGEEAATPHKKSLAWLFHLEWMGLVLVLLAIYPLVSLVVPNAIWTAAYLVLLLLIPAALWLTRKVWREPIVSATYTVLLAVTVAALLTAVYCLGLELADYGWQFKPQRAASVMVAPGAARIHSL
ncbi:MAG: hypothetical protein ABSG68_18525 [Thermoguttaceae bacterium]